jgi:UDP-sulfoquinovose synthase
MKKVLILGIDGYIGWTLANYLTEQGYEVSGLDIGIRRIYAKSLVPLADLETRCRCIGKFYTQDLLGDSSYILNQIKPDAIVHLAEQPSAPWSMHSMRRAIETQENNVLGNLRLLYYIKEHCPSAHLIKLGTLGEYGTPNCEIPEGLIPDGPMKGLMFPRSPGSFYHLSKVFDSYNIKFACDTWGLTSTDIMQGIVFGHEYGTRFDYDQYFGTVINRFCVQALARIPLTIYGTGGQTRGFLPLMDSLKCIQLAIDNPPKPGEYRTFNQFATILSINDIADMVMMAANDLSIPVTKQHLPNPRTEREAHPYRVVHDNLRNLGYVPNYDFHDVVYDTMQYLHQFKDQIDLDTIYPTTTWR